MYRHRVNCCHDTPTNSNTSLYTSRPHVWTSWVANPIVTLKPWEWTSSCHHQSFLWRSCHILNWIKNPSPYKCNPCSGPWSSSHLICNMLSMIFSINIIIHLQNINLLKVKRSPHQPPTLDVLPMIIDQSAPICQKWLSLVSTHAQVLPPRHHHRCNSINPKCLWFHHIWSPQKSQQPHVIMSSMSHLQPTL